jgi:hypothetical protein
LENLKISPRPTLPRADAMGWADHAYSRTYSRMWVNENSGWFIVSSEVWMLWFESSNVLSMLRSALALQEFSATHAKDD